MQNQKPYVISRGLKSIIKKWCSENDLIAPNDEFFIEMSNRLENELEKMFPAVEIISHREISSGIKLLVKESGLTPISLDRIYFKSELNMDITRKMLPNRDKYIIGNRFGTLPVNEQLKLIHESDAKEVVLIDDVLFSGGTIVSMIESLKVINVEVRLVCVGIGIEEGIENVVKHAQVKCYKIYDEVIDEICNWDFYPGVPSAGRLIEGSNNVGRPYCEPFGDITNWASIPEKYATNFSQFLIRESIRLFEEIEKLSGVVIKCEDLPRKVWSMPTDGTRFVDALKEYLH